MVLIVCWLLVKRERLALLVNQCRFGLSVSCPFDRCCASSIEECNLKTGRFSVRKRVVSGVANPVVLSASKFVKRRAS